MPKTETCTALLSEYSKRRFQQEWQDLWSDEVEAILKKAGFVNRLTKLYPKVRHAKD